MSCIVKARQMPFVLSLFIEQSNKYLFGQRNMQCKGVMLIDNERIKQCRAFLAFFYTCHTVNRPCLFFLCGCQRPGGDTMSGVSYVQPLSKCGEVC